jgi:hypothetical protein
VLDERNINNRDKDNIKASSVAQNHNFRRFSVTMYNRKNLKGNLKNKHASPLAPAIDQTLGNKIDADKPMKCENTAFLCCI